MGPRRVESAAIEDAEGPSPDTTDQDTGGTGAVAAETRYEILRKLGQGGAGAVFLVRDRESGERLALKQLLRIDNKSISRLKREFRSVADVSHPNLIKLYDLGRSENGWFITMEYVEGVDLMTYLGAESRPSETPRAGGDQVADLDRSRLITSFQQLATGIHALHRTGMLHRDLKPSNVMVTNGRVIVLDFGLVREVGESAVTVTIEDVISGTPAYMAPEQVAGGALTPACDWYAFGVMLYEALSGCLPFDGKVMEILRSKLERDPTPLERLAADVPASLNALCMGCLRRPPSERPAYDEVAAVLASLGAEVDRSVRVELEAAPTEQVSTQQSIPDALFGRSRETTTLWQAMAEVQQGSFTVVHVRGPSGAGKSALITTFLDRLENQSAHREDVLVLRSRCYEREAMPFKALDGLIDALVQYLERENDVLVGHILPSQLAELARLFPVLERLRAVQRLTANSKPRVSAMQERERAELALRELITRLASHRPVLMWVDDLQWGDLDSASIFKGWIDSFQDVPVMLLLSYRGEERATNAALSFLDECAPAASVQQHQVDLAPLHSEDVEAMCLQRLGDMSTHFSPLVTKIVEEARGSPFFASQLLTLAQAKLARGETDLESLSIEGVVSQASLLLTPSARRLLNVLAIAGRPVPLKAAFSAGEVRRDGRALLHSLRSLRLTRVRLAAGAQLLEVYHDRVREAVLAALSPSERRQTQCNLLRALETIGVADPDWMHVLAIGGGEMQSALRYGLLAAERADQALAFERAAHLYRQCIELSDDVGAQGSEIWLKLATALSHCRQGPRAAEAYLQAASRASPERSVELLRLAASHLLRSGRFEEGRALAMKVLSALELDVPSSEAGLYAAIGWELTRLRLRGMTFKPRTPEEVPERLVVEASTYGWLAIDMQCFDPLVAALFQARSTRLTLDVGVPYHVSSAFCAQATMACVSGTVRDGERASVLLDRAEELAGSHELARARVLGARAVCSFLLGRPAPCVGYATEAERIYRGLVGRDGSVAAEYYHRFAVAAVRIGSLLQLGHMRSCIADLRSEQEEARSTENRTANLHLTMIAAVADTIEGKAESTRERLVQERSELSTRSFGPLHLLHCAAVMWTGGATGKYEWAASLWEEDWPRFLRSPVRRSAYMSALAHREHARLLLSAHVARGTREDPAALVRDNLRALGKLPKHLGQPELPF